MILHFPLTLSIAAVGACILYLIEHSLEVIPGEIWWIFTAALSLILLSVFFLSQLIQYDDLKLKGYKIIRMTVLLVIALLVFIQFLGLPTLIRVGAMAAVMIIPIGAMIRFYIVYKIAEARDVS
jgi:glucan phosphoethanolaminetransferase (alkaline phosphatase superfamily)